MFFQWRQAKFGPEKFHSATVGHRGVLSRTYQETSSLGNELQNLGQVSGSRVRAKVAIVIDWDSWWGMTTPDSLPSVDLDWSSQINRYHAALYNLHQTVDAVPADGPFENYDMIVVPNQYALVDDHAELFSEYVRKGGVLVVGPFSGVVDDHERVHTGGAPGPLRELLGVEIDEWWPLSARDTQTLNNGTRVFRIYDWAEWLETHSDTVVAGHYASGPLAGRAAVTERHHGHGCAVYISCVIRVSDLTQVLSPMLARAGLPIPSYPAQVEVVTRSTGQVEYTFILNHSESTFRIRAPKFAQDLLTENSGDIPLGSFGVVVLSYPTSSESSSIPLTLHFDEIHG